MSGKLTYREQLLDPRWQRRRLEILSRDNWTCVSCESKEKTLHVHHKRYGKGLMAWEHADVDLETLCDECHAAAGRSKSRFDAVLAFFPSVQVEFIATLLYGLGHEHFEKDEQSDSVIEWYWAGTLAAWAIENSHEGSIDEIAALCAELGAERVQKVLRQELLGGANG